MGGMFGWGAFIVSNRIGNLQTAEIQTLQPWHLSEDQQKKLTEELHSLSPDFVVETREAPSVLADQHRVEAPVTITGNRQFQFARIRQYGLAAIAIAVIPASSSASVPR
jgi:hypothetical protein